MGVDFVQQVSFYIWLFFLFFMLSAWANKASRGRPAPIDAELMRIGQYGSALFFILAVI